MSEGDTRKATYDAGRTRFMGLDVLVAPGALIPRAETELLGRTAVATIAKMSLASPRIVDMCCGSGNLACAIAACVPTARVWATDLTDGAVALARANVRELQLEDRVTVLQGDLFRPLVGLGVAGTIDLVVCNPPYISSGKLATERAELLELEPREAFDGGPYGVSIFQRVIREALEFLRPGGMLMFEVGLGQGAQVNALLARAKGYDQIALINDEAGEPRVVGGTRTMTT